MPEAVSYAVLTPRQRALALSVALYRVNGDLPGHEFHGNQYTDVAGGGKESVEAARAPIPLKDGVLTWQTDADGKVSIAGIEGRRWDDWTSESDNINDLLAGKVTGSMYDAFGSKLTDKEIADLKTTGELIQAAAETHAVTGELWRGESAANLEEAIGRYTRGQQVTFDRLTSATTQPSIAAIYSKENKYALEGPTVPILMRIQRKGGTEGIQAIPDIGAVPSAEIIMPRGASFRVARIVPPGGAYYPPSVRERFQIPRNAVIVELYNKTSLPSSVQRYKPWEPPGYRPLGDVPGHEFHGNQWTDVASTALSEKHGTTLHPEAAAFMLRDGTLVRGNSMHHQALAERAGTTLAALEKEGVVRLVSRGAEVSTVPTAAQAKLLADHWKTDRESRHFLDVTVEGVTLGSLTIEGQITADAIRNFTKRALDNPRDKPPIHEVRYLGDLPGHEFHGNQYTSGLSTTGDAIASAKVDKFIEQMPTGMRRDLRVSEVQAYDSAKMASQQCSDYLEEHYGVTGQQALRALTDRERGVIITTSDRKTFNQQVAHSLVHRSESQEFKDAGGTPELFQKMVDAVTQVVSTAEVPAQLEKVVTPAYQKLMRKWGWLN